MTWAHPSALLAQTAFPAPQMCSFNDRHFFLTVLGAGRLRPRCQWALPRPAEATFPQCPHREEHELPGAFTHQAGSVSGLQGPTLATLSKRAPQSPVSDCHAGARASRRDQGATGVWSVPLRRAGLPSPQLHALTRFLPLGPSPSGVGVSPTVAVGCGHGGVLSISHGQLAGQTDPWASRPPPPERRPPASLADLATWPLKAPRAGVQEVPGGASHWEDTLARVRQGCTLRNERLVSTGHCLWVSATWFERT